VRNKAASGRRRRGSRLRRRASRAKDDLCSAASNIGKEGAGGVMEFELGEKEQPTEASRQITVGGALGTVQETKRLWHRDDIWCWCFQGQQMEKGQSKQMIQGASLCRLLPARPLFTSLPLRHGQDDKEADIHHSGCSMMCYIFQS
jgi:hypothetical protein